MALLSFVAVPACSEKNEYDAAGTFEAESITVSAESTGKILGFYVKEGDSVTEGQLLCETDSTQLVLHRKQLEYQYAAVMSGSPDLKKQMALYDEQLAKLNQEWKRTDNLVKEGASAPRLRDDIEAQIRLIERQRDAAIASLGKNVSAIGSNASAIQVQIDQLNDLIDKCRVLSPCKGVIQIKYANAGEVTAPGHPLVRLVDTSEFYLRAYFTSMQIADVRVGQKISVSSDFGGGRVREYDGCISWISEECEFTPKSIQTRDTRANLVYAVKIRVQNDGMLKTGMYGEARIGNAEKR